MTEVQVAPIEPGDAGSMRALVALFGDAFDEPRMYQDAQPDDAYLAALLARDHFVALVARDQDRIVGGLAAYVLDKFEQARAEVYIYDLAVAATHRRRGIATALIEALKPIARARGAWVIFV
jgi:ribosomal protein S18 acetylase RimI-like enzyme